MPPSLGSAGGIGWHQLLTVPCRVAGNVCEWGISGLPLQGNGAGTGHKGWRDGAHVVTTHHLGREDEEMRRDKMKMMRIEETR